MNDSVNSMNSTIASPEVNNVTKSYQLRKLMSMIKQSRKIFVGTYTERRYVKAVPEYRDIVVIGKEEDELISSLKEIQKVIRSEFGEKKWLGITCNVKDDEVQDYNLWVELEQVPFGKHWFQIRSLKIKENTVQFQLKYLRPFQAKEREYLDDGNYPTFDLREILTYSNMCEVVRFMAVLIMSIITLFGNFLWHASDYSLKLTRELSHLIEVMTPIIFGFYELLSKCIGGLYWLVYMFFNGNPNRPIPPPHTPMLLNNDKPIRTPIMVDSGHMSYRKNYNLPRY